MTSPCGWSPASRRGTLSSLFNLSSNQLKCTLNTDWCNINCLLILQGPIQSMLRGLFSVGVKPVLSEIGAGAGYGSYLVNRIQILLLEPQTREEKINFTASKI